MEEYDRTRDMYEGSDKFASALEIVPRTFNPRQCSDNFKLTVRFEAYKDEKIFGMGTVSAAVSGCERLYH